MIQYNHHAALVHTLWRRKKREKKNEKLIIKMQQAAASNIISWSTCFFFLKNQPTKKTKNRGKKLEKKLLPRPLYLVYLSHQGRFGQPRTNWRRGRLQKAATTRDRCVVHMCASSVLSRRATSPAPAQRKTCGYFSTSSRWGHEKTFFAFVRVCQLSTDTYVPRVSYARRNSIPLFVCCSF